MNTTIQTLEGQIIALENALKKLREELAIAKQRRDALLRKGMMARRFRGYRLTHTISDMLREFEHCADTVGPRERFPSELDVDLDLETGASVATTARDRDRFSL